MNKTTTMVNFPLINSNQQVHIRHEFGKIDTPQQPKMFQGSFSPRNEGHFFHAVEFGRRCVKNAGLFICY